MLSVFLTVLVVVNGQSCLRANNTNGLPPFMDYNKDTGSDLTSGIVPQQHQAIIPSYRFTCCGNITEWGVDVHPAGGRHNMKYTLNLQVWRPSPTVQTTSCYSLVGNNMFTSVSLSSQRTMVTPLPQERINFQPGDVLGFSLKNTDGSDGGVVMLMDSAKNGDSSYETEEVWHADFNSFTFGTKLTVGTQPGSDLNTFISAAPVISVAYGTTACPLGIASTTSPAPTQPTPSPETSSDPPVTSPSSVPFDLPTTTPLIPAWTEPSAATNPSLSTNSSEVTDPMFNQTEGTLLSCGGDTLSNYKLIIGSVIAILVVAIFTTLILVLGFARYMKDRIATVTNEAYGTGLHDMKHTERATYDYPNMENQAMKFINIKQNEAYATNAEAKPCVAYATNVTTERNNAYGIKFQDS